MANDRLKGQEVSIRVINAGVVVAAVDSVSTFNDEVMLDIKQAGYIGEFVDRYDDIMNGYSLDFEINLTRADVETIVQAMIDRAQRKVAQIVFNVIRTDFFPNGDSCVYTYLDVKWGAQPTTVGSRQDYVKKKFSGKCSERTTAVNQLP